MFASVTHKTHAKAIFSDELSGLESAWVKGKLYI